MGYLDGDSHPRDQVPTNGVRKTLFSVVFFTTVRPLLTLTVLSSKSGTISSLLRWSFLVELLLYSVILDFWFYTYHRACHEIPSLWAYHKTHHTIKHPIPVLASYSDVEQEIVEVVIVPLLTLYTMTGVFGLPMGFQSWWICQAFILFEEVMGHSGLRLYAVAPGLSSPVLRLVHCELTIEDHDLHHRRGWRKSFNYGKQTRVWDRILGTLAPRLESSQPDFDSKFEMPWF